MAVQKREQKKLHVGTGFSIQTKAIEILETGPEELKALISENEKLSEVLPPDL